MEKNERQLGHLAEFVDASVDSRDVPLDVDSRNIRWRHGRQNRPPQVALPHLNGSSMYSFNKKQKNTHVGDEMSGTRKRDTSGETKNEE